VSEARAIGQDAAAGEAPAPAAGALPLALRDAGIAALVALGLFGPIMGLRTVDHPDGLSLRGDWISVAWAVGIVFAGRFLLSLFAHRRAHAAPRPAARAGAGLAATRRLGKGVAPVLILLALALPFLPGVGRSQIDLGILILTYVMLGWGLNIVVGLAGLLDLGYVAFYAVGAYSFALLAHDFGLGFWACLPLAGIFAACWGLLLGFPVLRLRGDYLAIVTLAFGEIVHIVLLNWSSLTNGPNGIGGIPRPTLFGIPFNAGPHGFAAVMGIPYSREQRFIFLYYIILGLALLTNWATLRLRRLPIGRAWEAMREDEIACRSLGINTVNTKLTAFALGAMFGGFAGAFFATRQSFISPESFVFMESALILSIVVLGGMGSQLGVAIAAIVMIGGFEYFREFSIYRMLVFGGAMVMIMVWRPRGLVSSRAPTAFLKERRAVAAAKVGQGRG
jgi:branched-chain amino acid transport system permease protein